MDLNRIFNMLARMVMRSAVKTGVDHAARGGEPDSEMTPDERARARSLKDMAAKAQRVARLGRRFMK